MLNQMDIALPNVPCVLVGQNVEALKYRQTIASGRTGVIQWCLGASGYLTLYGPTSSHIKPTCRFAAAIASFGTVAQLGAFWDKTQRVAEMPI